MSSDRMAEETDAVAAGTFTSAKQRWPLQALWSAGHSAWFLQSAHLIDYNTIHAPQLDWQYRQELLLSSDITSQSSHAASRIRFDWDVTRTPAWLLFAQRHVHFDNGNGSGILYAEDAATQLPLGLSVVPYAHRDMLKEVAHVQIPSMATNTKTLHSSKLDSTIHGAVEVWCARAHALWSDDDLDNLTSLQVQEQQQHGHGGHFTKDERAHGTTLGRVVQQLGARHPNVSRDTIRQALVTALFTRRMLAGEFGYAHVRCGWVLLGNEKSASTADDWWLIPLTHLIQAKSHKGVLEQLWHHANFIARSVLGARLGVHELILARLIVCWVKLHYLLFQQHVFNAIADDLTHHPDRWLNVYVIDDDNDEGDENISGAEAAMMTGDTMQFHNRLVAAFTNASSSSSSQQQQRRRDAVASALCRRVHTYLVWWWSAFDVTAMLSGQQQQAHHASSSSLSQPANRWALKTSSIHSIFQTVNAWLMRFDPEDL